ncbi:hypothetical protein [Phenylobacterium sp.]|jgi:hypothetical protein|uniref:hypothetical protein n=1 Tax=Phenylobacterium sp. TaxID=1871053 RepID=UPI002F93C8D4
MRHIETETPLSQQPDPAVMRLVRREMHAGEAMALALLARDHLRRLTPANDPQPRQIQAA